MIQNGDLGETVLYRLYDAGGALLYVGVSAHYDRRMRQHKRDKWWWPEVAEIRIVEFSSVAAAADAEDVAIRTELPRYNAANSVRYAGCAAPIPDDNPAVPAIQVVVDAERQARADIEAATIARGEAADRRALAIGRLVEILGPKKAAERFSLSVSALQKPIGRAKELREKEVQA